MKPSYSSQALKNEEPAMSAEINEIQIACFRLGDDTYAVDIMRIKEIIRPQKMTGLLKALPFVDGVINLRGVVIPVITLRKRFDLPPREADSLTRLLIVTIARQVVGLIVDEMTEVITVPVKNLKPPPIAVRGVGSEYLIGVCLVGEEMVMLLNLDTILTNQETLLLKGIKP
jgi:purine-binding chemotaxis protein CheW